MTAAAVAIHTGDLELGGGLLALVRPALDLVGPGGVIAVLSTARSVREDLASWCRLERHEYLGTEQVSEGLDRHLVARGRLGVPRPFPAGPLAEPTSGLAPPGARIEPGGPAFPFDLLDGDRVAVPEAGALYDQAVAAVWDATRDIPWHTVKPLPDELERAVGQIMSFLAENELAALYVPARFLPRIPPAFVDVAKLLAAQLSDEARHIDVFLRRARLPGVSSAVTSRSLLTLLQLDDLAEAAFLLSVLGEGTFLDLLRFVETHAPDEATAELCRRARIDETRHVHFGIAHVRHALANDPSQAVRLETAVRRRADTLAGAGIPAPLFDALTVLAARGTDPAAVRRGHQAVRELVETMQENRRRRVIASGFPVEKADILAGLHTSNFM
jgi:hypothetical protein